LICEADFPCQPYRIGRVVHYADRVMLEIIHNVMGKDCLCQASSMQAALAVSIARTYQPIESIIKSEESASCAPLLPANPR
jgi:hypothetical protein